MLRSIALSLLFLLTASAQAQDARTSPTAGERVLLVASSIGGGLLDARLGTPALLFSGAATHGMSEVLGLDPTIGGTLLDTAIGTGTVYAVYWGSVLAMTEIGGYTADASRLNLDVMAVSYITGMAAVGFAHGTRLAMLRTPKGVDISPALLRSPTGEQATGLNIRVGL